MSVEFDATDDQADVLRQPVRKRRRLSPRFRLRTLFVAAVLMSLLLGWYGRHVYRVRQERAAAERLRQVGAQLSIATFEYGGMTLPADLYGWFPWFYVEEHTVVALDSAKGATDADLQHLGRLRGLTSLWLRGDGFTDEALRRARDAKSIQDLTLLETSITGETFAEFGSRERLISLYVDSTALPEPTHVLERIEALPNLAYLQTRGVPLTVEGMRATAKLQELRRLIVHDPPAFEPAAFSELSKVSELEELSIQTWSPLPIGDEEFAAICQIKSLRMLALSAPQLTDAGFAHVADLPDLRELYVIGCPNVTDAGAKALAKIRTLEQVSISSYSVTDEVFNSLSELPNLKSIDVPPALSRKAAQRFAKDHPGCEVWYPDPYTLSTRLVPQGEAAASDDAPAD
jgi:hypothetical protein